MSAKGLLRYRSEVGATDPLNGRTWPEGTPGGKKSPSGSLSSSASSEDGRSPEAGGRMLEEDSFDEGIEDILARSPSCNLCGHAFYSSADFLNHVRMHFSGPPAKGKKRSVEEAWPEDKGRNTSEQDWDQDQGGRIRRTPPPAYNTAVNASIEKTTVQPNALAAQSVDDAALDQLQQFLPNPTEELDTPEFERCLSPLNLPETQMNIPEPRQPEPQQVPQQQQTLSPPLSSPLLPHPELPENFLEQLLAIQKTASHPVPSYQPDLQAQISQIPAHFGFNLNFPNNPFFRPSDPQFSLPLSLPHLPSYPSHPLLRPTNIFKCFMCPATFDKREALMYHLNFHTSYSAAAESVKQGSVMPNMTPYFPNLQHPNPPKQPSHFNQQHPQQTHPSKKVRSNQQPNQYSTNPTYPGYPIYPPFPSPEASPLSGGSYSSGNHSPRSVCTHPSPRCSCEGCTKAKQAKKPKKQVEDIDPETLKKIQKLEWERKHGYWCTKCKKRFPNQAKLVDHMSYSGEHNFIESDKDKNSDVDSAHGSPGSMGQQSPTLMSPLDVSEGIRSPLDASGGIRSPLDASGEIRSPLNISGNISPGFAHFGDLNHS